MARTLRKRLPSLFFDRDGTLIEERDYLGDPKHLKFLPGVIPGLRRLKNAGFPILVVSNQSGVGRGLLSLSNVERVNRHFIELLKSRGVRLDGLYYCLHAPNAKCRCRKPALGLLKQASRELGVAWRRSISVGDRQSDVELGQRTGGLGVLVLTGYGRQNWKAGKVPSPDYVAKNFTEVVRWILKEGSHYGR